MTELSASKEVVIFWEAIQLVVTFYAIILDVVIEFAAIFWLVTDPSARRDVVIFCSFILSVVIWRNVDCKINPFKEEESIFNCSVIAKISSVLK